MTDILIGYRVGSGEPVYMAPKHTMLTGMTGDAGKTTAIEGIASRWPGQKFVVFLAKPGEQSFAEQRRIKPFFKQKGGWQYVESLIEASQGEKIKIIRTTLIKVCEGTKTLDDVFGKVSHKIAEYDSKERGGFEYDMLIQVREYLRQVIKELESHELADRLDLQAGINVVDLADFSAVMQSMVVGAIAEDILRNHTNTSIVIPEAWQTIPNGRKSPATESVEALIRQGRVRGNFVLIDSQDIAGVDTKIRRHIANYLLGKQQDEHEIERTLKAIPLPPKSKPKADEVQTLKRGQFFAVVSEELVKIYARPAWMDEHTAIAIAKDYGCMADAQIPQPTIVHPTLHIQTHFDEETEPVSALESAELDALRSKARDLERLSGELKAANNSIAELTRERDWLKGKADAEEARANENGHKVQEYEELTTALWKALLPHMQQAFAGFAKSAPPQLLVSATSDGRTDIQRISDVPLLAETVNVTIKERTRMEKLSEDTLDGKVIVAIADGEFDQPIDSKSIAKLLNRRWQVSFGGGRSYEALNKTLAKLVARPYELLSVVDDGEKYTATAKAKAIKREELIEE